MATVLEIEKEVTSCTLQGEAYLTEEERTNLILDGINNITKDINSINNCYLKLFSILDDLSKCTVSNNEDTKALKTILTVLGSFTTKTSIVFSMLSSNNIIQSGCKSALNDLRANIRTLREYIEDIEETFLLREDNSEINDLIAELM